MLNYVLTLSFLIVLVIAIRAIFKRKTSARVIYALWLAVVVRLCLPFSLFTVDLPFLPVIPDTAVTENAAEEQSAPAEVFDAIPENDPSEAPDMSVLDAPVQDAPVQDVPTQDTPVILGNAVIEDGAASISPSAESPADPAINDSAADAPVKEEAAENADAAAADTVSAAEESNPWAELAQSASRCAELIEAPFKAVWLAGSAIPLVIFAVSWTVFGVRLKKSRKYHSTADKVKVYTSDKVACPCVAGIRPAIYIPPSAAEQTDALPLVTLHERTHIRHGDTVWSLIRAAALVIHWWNPLVWTAVVLSKRDAELACDESVAKSMEQQEKLAYARMIVDMIPVQKSYAIGFGNAPIKERILMLTKDRKNAIIAAVLAVMLTVSSVGCAFVSGDDNVEAAPPAVQTSGEVTDDADSTDEAQTANTSAESTDAVETEAVSETETEAAETEEAETNPPETAAAETTASDTQVTPPTPAAPVTSVTPTVTSKPETADPEPNVPERKVVTGNGDFKAEMRVYGNLWYPDGEAEKYIEKSINNGRYVITRADTLQEAKELIKIATYSSSRDSDLAVLEKYDESFFKEKSLLMIHTWHGSTGYSTTFSNFTFDGKTLSFDVKTLCPTAGSVVGGMMSYPTCILEIDGILPENIEFQANETRGYQNVYIDHVTEDDTAHTLKFIVEGSERVYLVGSGDPISPPKPSSADAEYVWDKAVPAAMPSEDLTFTAVGIRGSAGGRSTWTYDLKNTLTISGSGEIPSYSENNQPWKDYKGKITVLKIEEGITAIGKYAFFELEWVQSIVIPDSVETIGSYAFAGNYNLRSIVLGKNLKNIGSNAFTTLSDICIESRGAKTWYLKNRNYGMKVTLTDDGYKNGRELWEYTAWQWSLNENYWPSI